MTQQELSQKTMEGYRRDAGLLLERYDWQLVARDVLVERALELIAHGTANSFMKALVGAYCMSLYQAFLGEFGPEPQRRACDELGRLLATLIAIKYPNVPPDERLDVAQNALKRVWRNRENCREPIAFIAFAIAHLLSAVQLTHRQLHRIG